MTSDRSSTPTSDRKTSTNAKKRPSNANLLFEVIIAIVIPTLILKNLSAEDSLGPAWALVVALSLPLGYGIYEFIQAGRVKLIPALGFVNILLTGAIGLFELDAAYIAIKEAMIPLIIGLVTVISIKTRYPLIKTFVYNDIIMDTERVDQALSDHDNHSAFNKVMVNATWMMGASFLLSGILNYVLAKWIVTAPSGTAEFNSQLGTMTMLSYPVIVLPCMVITIYMFYYLVKSIRKLTGLTLEEVLNT